MSSRLTIMLALCARRCRPEQPHATCHEQKQRGSAGRPRDEVALTDLRRAHGDAMRRDGPSQAWRARRTDQGD